jgi:hypothetical protein
MMTFVVMPVMTHDIIMTSWTCHDIMMTIYDVMMTSHDVMRISGIAVFFA